MLEVQQPNNNSSVGVNLFNDQPKPPSQTYQSATLQQFNSPNLNLGGSSSIDKLAGKVDNSPDLIMQDTGAKTNAIADSPVNK